LIQKRVGVMRARHFIFVGRNVPYGAGRGGQVWEERVIQAAVLQCIAGCIAGGVVNP